MELLSRYIFLTLLLIAASNSYGHETNYAGQTCEEGMTDELKCMVCTLMFEAHNDHYEGMLAVGQVVMQRVEDSRYPDTICRVVYQNGQFTALDGRSRRLPNDHAVMDRILTAARDAIAAGGNGFLGFRACGNREGNIGGNCFRETGDASEFLYEDETEFAEAGPDRSDAESLQFINSILNQFSSPSQSSSASDATR